MDTSWISTLISIVFWVVAMTLITRWMARSRMRIEPADDGMQLRHPLPTLVIGLAATLFSIGMSIAAVTWADGPGWLFAGVLVGSSMLALSLSLVADYYFARHRVDQRGMHYGRMAGQRGSFHWTDVKRVHFSEAMNWYWLTLESGETVRVSGLMIGLPIFAAHVLEQVPADRIDATAGAKLEAAAQGRLHKLWLI